MECSIEGCSRKVLARGWCSPHYLRWRRTGDPLGVRFRSDEDLFWFHVDKTDTCWLLTAYTSTKGYGSWRVRGKNVRAHRWAYERFVGPIPPGLAIDHLCRVRNCVNPDHLEPVTTQENNRRALRPARTHCRHGHPLDEENTYLRPNGRTRECRTCLSDQQRRHLSRARKIELMGECA